LLPPRLTLTKSVVSGTTLNADGSYTVSYRVVVSNTGGGSGRYDLVDVPSFGPAISIVSATVTSSDVTLPNPASWNPLTGAYQVIGGVSILPGESDTYTMTFVTTINASLLDGTFGTCFATHASNESEFFNRADVIVNGQPVDTDEACVPPPTGRLTITKTVAPKPLVPNPAGVYDVVYTITVTNVGDGPTTYTLTDNFAFGLGAEILNVAITSQPAGVTLVPGFNGSTRSQVAVGAIPANATHTYQIAVKVRTTALANEEAFDCTLQPGEVGTGLLNRASVVPSAEACVEIPKFADLELTKSVSKPTADVGSNVVFTIYVTNKGPFATTGVSVQDLLPAGVTYVSHSGGGTFDRASGIWTIGDLGVGMAATLEITVRVDREGKITNLAQVWSSSLPDPDSTPANSVPSEDDQAQVDVTGQPVVIVQPPLPPPATLPPTGGGTHAPVTAAVWLTLAGLALVVGSARRRAIRNGQAG
jgi:uncharacterized repeat protein (TIGR01451 family)